MEDMLNKRIVSSIVKRFKCITCGKWYCSLSTLGIHQRLHTGDRPYACTKCGKAFAQSGNLVSHVRAVHTNLRPYACHICAHRFAQSNSLQRHIVAMHTSERPHECPICGKAFAQAGNMRVHVRTHTDDRPYQCTQCIRAFAHSSALKRHELTHSGERPFSCKHCSHKFTQSGNLRCHIAAVHVKSKPHVCSTCGRCFVSAKRLKTHRQRAHSTAKSGEPPDNCYFDNVDERELAFLRSIELELAADCIDPLYVCAECTKRFYDADALRMHISTHSKLKAFGCGLCGRSFASKFQAVRHFELYCPQM